MNIHLKTTLTLLTLAAIVAGLYFIPVVIITGLAIFILYGAIYAENKKTEENKNEEKTTRENN
jgi:uncharacterized membrane protein YjgN (DUF898 family)